MKLIKAYIKERKLADVVAALLKIDGFNGVNITEGKGFGRGRGNKSSESSTDSLLDYIENVQLEVICRDDLVKIIVKTIEQNAHTGLKGDGKIFVCDVTDIIRISTGERGKQAI